MCSRVSCSADPGSTMASIRIQLVIWIQRGCLKVKKIHAKLTWKCKIYFIVFTSVVEPEPAGAGLCSWSRSRVKMGPAPQHWFLQKLICTFVKKNSLCFRHFFGLFLRLFTSWFQIHITAEMEIISYLIPSMFYLSCRCAARKVSTPRCWTAFLTSPTRNGSVSLSFT